MIIDKIHEDHMNVLDGLWTYSLAAFALFLANISTVTSILGFVLLVARLSYELPKAVRAFRAAVNKDK